MRKAIKDMITITAPLFVVFAVVIGLTIGGCGKKKDESDKLLEQMEQHKAAQDANTAEAAKLGPDILGLLRVQQVIAANGIPLNKLFLFDSFYTPVSTKFVFDNIASDIFDATKTGPIYSAEQYDCDDEALSAMVIARRSYYGRTGEKRSVAILFGEFHYHRAIGGRHAINCFITKDGNGHKLEFFEPQTWKLVQLTPEEIQSCTFCRF